MLGINTRKIQTRGTWPLVMAIFLSSMFLGHLSFLSHLYQPALIVCLLSLCTRLNKAKVGWAEVILLLACGISIVLGNPMPIFNSWMRLGLFCIVLLITTPLISSPAIEQYRVRLFNWVSLICIFVGVGSFFAYFLGINCMRSYAGTYSTQLGGSFGGLTIQSMLLGPLAALGMLRCVSLIMEHMQHGTKASIYLYFSTFTCFASVLMASSRGAAGATLISVCFLIYTRHRHKMSKLIKIVLCLSCLAIPLAPALSHFSSGLIAKQEANMERGGTFDSREELWKARMKEFQDSPIYGVGFAAQRIFPYASTLHTGVIEPGSSYGAVFAMTGLLGGSVFLFILGSALIKTKKQIISLPQIYLVFFAFHMLIEGYVFAGGSPLCFIFWLCIGAACAIKHNHQLNQHIV